jgi:hypothetical protein
MLGPAVVRTREDLARFVNGLRHEFETAGSEWVVLPRFGGHGFQATAVMFS